METLPATTNSALAIQQTEQLAHHFVKSGFFKDATDASQAVVKIVMGQEMGLEPGAAMRGIDIVKGQISVRAHTMAAMLRRSGRYDYRVLENTTERCNIAFLQNGEAIGYSEFTIDEARKAGLAGKDTWKSYPKMMLYNRAMSQGCRMYCPDLFLGAVYAEGEIEDAPFVPDVQVVDQGMPEPGAEETAGAIIPASDEQIKYLRSLMSQAGTAKGTSLDLVHYLGADASKELTSQWIEILLEHGVENGLPASLMRLYVTMLCKHSGVGKDEIMPNVRDMCGQEHTDLSKLDRKDQQIIINWLVGEREEEPLDQKIVLLIEMIAQRTGYDPTDIRAWIHHKAADTTDGKITQGLLSTLSSYTNDQFHAEIPRFVMEQEETQADLL